MYWINDSIDEDDGERVFPMLCTYVTIKLDAVKSVEILEDEEATAAARTLDAVSKVYVGYVADDGDWDDDDDEDNWPWTIRLLRCGLSQPSPEEFIEQDMYTPVFPNTKHPSRKPVTPSKPLPVSWQDCYLATFETVTLRSPAAWKKWDTATDMPSDAYCTHSYNVCMDERRREQLDPTPRPPINLEPMVQNSGPHVMPVEPLYVPAGRDGAVTSCQSVSSLACRSISAASVEEENELTAPVPPPIAVLSYDLTTVEKPADPQDLLAEIRFIERLYKEARARVPARKARAAEELAHAIAEAKRIDDAAFEDLSKAGTNARPKVFPESSIHPIRAVRAFFGKHPFWGVPADSPPALAVKCSRWRGQLQRYFCGTTSPTMEKGSRKVERRDR
ncbi:hypothetical protein HWV62_21888 [Athelia sp. TMB]|nr:hypothetical protein HWV62_21888 [Athelia sp. TMB]